MTSSLINNIVSPDSTAQAVTHEDLARVVNQLVLRQVMFFASIAERTTVLANVLALHGQAPPAGAISHISTLSRYDRYTGTGWVALLDQEAVNAWVAWTPTLTNLTLGNGTVTARRRLVGKTLDWRFKFKLGNTSAVGTSPRFTLPFTPHASYVTDGEDLLGRGNLLEGGIADHPAVVRLVSGTTVEIFKETDAAHTTVTATVPFTWGDTDVLSVAGTIELA